MFHASSKIILFGLLGLTAFAITPTLPASASASGSSTTANTASHRGRGSAGFISSLQTHVGLTPEQSDAVRGILADQREQTSAIREKSDAKIRAVLTSEQQPKFDAFLAELKNRRTQQRSQQSS